MVGHGRVVAYRLACESSALVCDHLCPSPALLSRAAALVFVRCSHDHLDRRADARARAELTEEIKASARRHLAEQGAPALSLRAVARELDMVSSAVYRYFPSRDELLTALIIDAYNAVGAAAERADAACAARSEAGGWPSPPPCAAWALANPHEYALIYGSPVPATRPRPTPSTRRRG